MPKIVVSEEIAEPFSPKFAHELDRLEPYGVGHKKPLFSIRAHGCPAREVKPNSPHLVVKSEFIDLMYFGGAKQKRLIESDIEKYIVFDCNITKFKGREYIKGYIRDVVYNAMSGNISASIFANAMAKLRGEAPDVRVHYLSAPETRAFVAERANECGYGLCLLASSRASAEAYGETGVRNVDVFAPTARNVANTLLISPQRDADLSAFNCFVFLDEPSDFNILCLAGKEVYVNKDLCGYGKFASRVNTERAYLLDIFAALRKDAARLEGGNAAETAKLCRWLGFDVYELIFALSVFEELGLLSYAGGKLEIYRGVKADLNDSAIYTRIRELQRRNTQEKRG